MNFAERAARNEEIFRGVNERIEEGAEKHGATGRQPFHCECGRGMCFGRSRSRWRSTSGSSPSATDSSS